MRRGLGAAPVPFAGVVGADVAEPARTAALAGHAREEFVGEARDDLSATPSACSPSAVNATCSAVVGRGSIFSRAASPARSQPGQRGLAIGDLEQEEAGLAQMAVADPDQALDVA